MKNYKVIATRNFIDSEEKVNRIEGKEFECTKERYEFLKSKGAVELVEIQETLKIEPKETIPIKIVEKEIIEEEVQAVASEIVDETQEQDKTVEEIINEIVDEMIESEKMNKIIDETVDEVVEEIITKKKKSNKK